ncbi:MAG: transaldolase, partial [Duodenibacillus sp.]|nr:transaldolase [Duodenibacillus sp.]
LYEAAGVPRERVLIKVAATWEGCEAARALEAEGIHCNLTLIFALEQAEASAQAGATLISPFVGRIYDWHKKAAGAAWDEAANAGAADPGVQSVARIYRRLKAAGSRTQVMGASFRNKGQILALAGCDLLTISPKLIDELAAGASPVAPALTAEGLAPTAPVAIGEAAFRYGLCMNAMACDKLSQGIRAFVADTVKLEAMLA